MNVVLIITRHYKLDKKYDNLQSMQCTQNVVRWHATNHINFNLLVIGHIPRVYVIVMFGLSYFYEGLNFKDETSFQAYFTLF